MLGARGVSERSSSAAAVMKKFVRELERAEKRLEPFVSEHYKGPRPSVDLSMLDPLAAYLDPSKVPPTPAVLSADVARIPLSSFRLLGKMARIAGKYQDPEIFRRLAELWPSLWIWMKYFLRRAELETGDNPEAVLSCIAETLSGFFKDDRMFSAVLETPDTAEVISQYWALEDTLVPTGNFCKYAALLADLLDRKEAISGVISGAHGAQNTAKLAVRRLRYAITGRILAIQNVHTQLLLLQALSYAGNSELQTALLLAGIIPCVIDCMLRLSSQSISKDVCDCVMVCRVLVRKACIHTDGGYTWVIQALEYNVISAYLGCAKFALAISVPAHRSFYCSLLTDAFAPYLVYRPVIRAAGKQLEMWTPSGSDPEPLRTAWNTFRSLVAEREVIRVAFHNRYSRKCSFCKALVQTSTALKECSGCQGPRYCSRQCQYNDWARHRRPCQTFRELYYMPDQSSLQITTADADFFLTIAVGELERHTDVLNRRIAREFPEVALESLLFAVDLTRVPTDFVISKQEMSYTEGELRGRIPCQVQVLWCAEAITVARPIPKPPSLEESR